MINHIIPAIIVVILILMGHISKRKALADYNRRGSFIVDFNNLFFDMVNGLFCTQHLDREKYNAVIQDIDKVQQELGMDGVLNEFYDPIRGIKGRNYQLFMNIMPEIRAAEADMDSIIMGERINQLLGLCEDALRRHLGNLNRAIEHEKKGLYNPITCMGEGIRWVVGLPIDILHWAGLYSINKSQKIKANMFFKLISNIIVLIGLIGSIITIVLGWDEFVVILNNCVSKK